MNFFARVTKSNYFKQTVVVLFFAISLIVWSGFWIMGKYYVSTDNAYINANVVQVAPRVMGKVTKLYITNNQHVEKNQPLFEIDQEPFQLAFNSAQAQLAFSNAELENATLTKNRTLSLVTKKYTSPQDGDNATANFKTAVAHVDQAKARLAETYLNMEYTKIYAPTSGWVSNVTLREGDIVTANQPLFALISDEEFWVDANFKETEMAAIVAGQTATIVTDLYPKHTFKGIVESISGGSGSAFSLLPPQNATGNWVKVTQRVPVRIRVLETDPHYPLRIGTSAYATINLHDSLQTGTQRG